MPGIAISKELPKSILDRKNACATILRVSTAICSFKHLMLRSWKNYDTHIWIIFCFKTDMGYLQLIFGYIWPGSCASKCCTIICFFAESTYWELPPSLHQSEMYQAQLPAKDIISHIKDGLLISFTNVDHICIITSLWCGQQFTTIETWTDTHIKLSSWTVSLVLICRCSLSCHFADWISFVYHITLL